MPINIEVFKEMDIKKTNLERIVDFLREDGRAWSVSELASKLDLDSAIVSEISRRREGKELIRKQDGRRVWIALNKGGVAIMDKTGVKAGNLRQLIDDYLNDDIAKRKVQQRDIVCEDIKNGIHGNMSVVEFQELVSPLRGESNSIRNNRFANRVNTQKKVDSLLNAIESSSFEEASNLVSSTEGVGMDVLSMMLHIMNRDMFHCVNGQAVRVIDRMMEKGLFPRQSVHKYMTCKSPTGIGGFVKTYEDYDIILNKIQDMGKMTKSQTDFFIGWVDHDIRRRYSLGNVSLSGL